MVTKDEWREWRDSVVTKRLLELIVIGRDQAKDDLVSNRGVIADFERGAIFQAEEVLDIIKSGVEIYG